MIDYGELSAAQFKNKYNEILPRKMSYQEAAVNLKVFTDELLEYQVKSGLLSAEDASKILKANEFFIPLYRATLKSKPTISKLSEQTENLIRPSRPGAKKLAKRKTRG